MDRLIDEMSEAYKNVAAAAAAAVVVIEARAATDAGGGEVLATAAYDAALEEMKQQWELFMASCDRAEGAIDEAKRRAECGLFFPTATAAAAATEEEAEGVAAMGDGAGQVDGPIAAGENAVGDDFVLLDNLMEIPDSWFVVDEEKVVEAAATETEGAGGAAMGDGVGEDAIAEAVDGLIATDWKGSAVREIAAGENVDLTITEDKTVAAAAAAAAAASELYYAAAAAAELSAVELYSTVAAAELYSLATSTASVPSAASATNAPGSVQEEST